MSSASTPSVKTERSNVGGKTGTGTQTIPVAEAPFAGSVSSVSYTPISTLTGAATNYRTLRLVNKGSDGSGSTVIASLAFSGSGVVATADDEKAITLSGTAANLVVAQGDILAWDETVAGTGLDSPGGLVQVEFTRGDVSA
jgi:hypothetical protein